MSAAPSLSSSLSALPLGLPRATRPSLPSPDSSLSLPSPAAYAGRAAADRAAHGRADTFRDSAVADGGAQGLRSTRTSQSTNVARDAVVRCIEERALRFQGFDTAAAQLEPVQLVRYGRGERFHFHTDWFPDAAHARAAVGGNRRSSFFAYVAASADLTGGGTNFPLLAAPRDARWCAFVDCDAPWAAGLTFRPRLGGAVFWPNLRPDGAGDERTLHAGLPVTSGTKIGMNIWTRQGPLGDDIRGPDV